MIIAALHPLVNHQPIRRSSDTNRASVTASVGKTIRLWRSRIRERHAARSFDYRDLQDLGMSKWDVERELSKPFWRA